MSNENGVLLVQALYPFTGKNNDELCFKKGDLIVVTQKEDGGWWEGTLNDDTGWFPSNYVKEHKSSDIGGSGTLSGAASVEIESPPLSPQQAQQQVVYRTMVSKEIVESERAHVAELKNLHTKYLTPLMASDKLTDAEFKQLTGNLEEVIHAHSTLLSLLEDQLELPAKEQRVGGTFLKMAPSLQAAHKAYIGNHPKAVCIIEKYKEELNSFMECQGAVRPGTLVLTTGLSQPFRRLDKYPGVLQEFHRHIEESHPDRGDTQRSTHVFRDLTTTCSSIRRQKQLELEVLTNEVQGWEGGDTLGVLGEIIHMRSVALLPDNRDRYLVLFPGCLVVLALSSRASSFIFEGKYSLNAVTVTKLEDGSQYKNAFEITGSHGSQMIAVCQAPSDQQQWVDILQQHVQNARNGTLTGNYKQPSTCSSPPVPPAHCGTVYAGRPYSRLTKYFAKLYRRKVITKQLLRSLGGVVFQDPAEAMKMVTMRTHRSECSIWLSGESRRTVKDRAAKRYRGRDPHPGLETPHLPRKEYKRQQKKNRNKLQKWKLRPLNLEGPPVREMVSSSSASSGSSSTNNPYGFIHRFSSSSRSSSSSSCSSSSSETITTSPTRGWESGWVPEIAAGKKMARLRLPVSVALHSQRRVSDCEKFKSLPPDLPTTSHGTSDPALQRDKTRVSSTLNIPAPLILIPGLSDGDSSGSPHVCDRTIYGSSSMDDATEGGDSVQNTTSRAFLATESRLSQSHPSQSRLFQSHSSQSHPSQLACYYSCSVEEEHSHDDFYAAGRRNVPLFLLPPSHSDPIPHHTESVGNSTPAPSPEPPPHYESHLVHVTKRIEAPWESECLCESQSHRSSDSGLADVSSMREGSCPLRGSSPAGSGRTLYSHRLSRGSLRTGRRCWSGIRAPTPDYALERDSFLPTPTPCCPRCTSTPLSMVSDSSSVSLKDAAAFVSPVSSATYRSGLYAHWWLKASIVPKPSTGPRFATLLSDISERPELPPLSPFPLKPSCHPVMRTRYSANRVSPVPSFASVPLIQKPDDDDRCSSVIDPEEQDEETKSLPGCHLELIDATLCRDPSFESQASQATVICAMGVRTPERSPSPKAVDSPQGECLRRTDTHLLSDISSMHSFYESEEAAGEWCLWRDPSDGLFLDFHRKGSFQSDHETSFSPRPSFSIPENRVHNLPAAKIASSCLPKDVDVSKLRVPGCALDRGGPPPLQRSKSLPKTVALDATSEGSALPLSHHNSHNPPANFNNGKSGAKPWSLSCLRPSPPLRPGFSIREDRRNPSRPRRRDESWHEDDALILRVIEHYCTSAKTRYTVNSNGNSRTLGFEDSSSLQPVGGAAVGCELDSDLVTKTYFEYRSHQKQLLRLLGNWQVLESQSHIITCLKGLIDNPQVIIAAEEKMIVEETRGNQIVLEEKSLVDTVYALKDQLTSMAQNYQELRTEFENERRQTQTLKKIIDQCLPLIRDMKTSNM